MHAVHWLRSRQEEYELIYWLSIVAYNNRDRSFNNRIYLLYLVLFFSAWIFVTLTLVASGGARLLQLVNSNDPLSAASILIILAVGGWSVFALWQSQKRSPVVFSEQDAALLCQMPINRRHVVLRWFAMPWLKSAISFWLIAIAIGFSFAELTMPGIMGPNRIFEYAGYGIRAWLVILPIHLTLFALQWAAGIYRRQQDIERRWLAWPIMSFALVLLTFLLMVTLNSHAPASLLQNVTGLLLFSLHAGFGIGNLSTALMVNGLFAMLALGFMYSISGKFSLSRAAQETREADTINTALHYGLAAEAQELQTKQRLGVRRSPTRLPASAGAAVLIWKDVLQSQRSFQLTVILNWLAVFSAMLSIPFLPDFGSRAFATAIWVFQVGKLSVTRLQSDLMCWSLVRQLPISHADFILSDLGLPYLLIVMISWVGLSIGSLVSKTPTLGWAILLPGMAAGAAAIAAFDVIRRSRSSLLLNGSVPAVSAGGILLGLVIAAVPLLIYTLLPRIAGLFLALFSSLILDRLVYLLAVRSYRNMDSS